MTEAGLRGYEFTQWYALLARAKTPRDIVMTLNATLLKSMADAEVKKRVGVEGGALSPGTPEQLMAFLRAELDSNAQMIRVARLKRE